jgi:hypothetical protein
MLLPPLPPARTEEREDGILDDLNDYHCFVQVAAQCGFAAASRVLGIPKSELSRRVAALEQRLGADRPLRSAVHAGPRWVLVVWKLGHSSICGVSPLHLRQQTFEVVTGSAGWCQREPLSP